VVPLPRPGQTVFVGRAASVQFSGSACFNFRIIRVDDQPTYEGWAWLDGYQLDANRQRGPTPLDLHPARRAPTTTLARPPARPPRTRQGRPDVTENHGQESAGQLIRDARAILASHTANDDGFCDGCLGQWARLVPHPCQQARWAAAVIERYDTGR
jgi:hypothetical protein